jgi:hypothetical protein
VGVQCILFRLLYLQPGNFVEEKANELWWTESEVKACRQYIIDCHGLFGLWIANSHENAIKCRWHGHRGQLSQLEIHYFYLFYLTL